MPMLRSHRATNDVPDLTASEPVMLPYLNRLYLQSRQALFHILLGDAEAEADVLKTIKALIEQDDHLDRCRKRIGEFFPGRLAVMFNLADTEDKLFPLDALRTSIREHIARHEHEPVGQHLSDADLCAISDLKRSSKLQQQLAYLVHYTPSKWLLEQEIPVVMESRRRRLGTLHTGSAAPGDGLPGSTEPKPSADSSNFIPDSYAWSRDTGRLRGLCLSGGGIRSATFNLGILQGLAKKDLLRWFDYCSSVSGGGYIHQWLAAWIKREEPTPPTTAGSAGLDAVCRHLIPLPDRGSTPEHPEPIRWLRRYSNYLTPQKGILSDDLWVTVAIWVRNTCLNQLVLICGLLSMLLAPHLFQINSGAGLFPKLGEAAGTSTSAATVINSQAINVVILILLALMYLLPLRSLVSGLHVARKSRSGISRLSNGELCAAVVAPLLAASLVVSELGFYFALPPLTQFQQVEALCAFAFCSTFVFNLSLTVAGGAFTTTHLQQPRSLVLRIAGFILAAALSASVCAGCMFVARNLFVTQHFFAITAPSISAPTAGSKPQSPAPRTTPAFQPSSTTASRPADASPAKSDSNLATAAGSRLYEEPSTRWRFVVTFGPAVVLLISSIGLILQCGLIGNAFEDRVLEWLGRVRGWITLYSMVWCGLIGISLFGHQLVALLVNSNWIKWPAVGTWILTTAGGVLAGKSSSTGGDPSSAQAPLTLRLLTLVGPPIYILGLLLCLSWIASQALFIAEGHGTWAVAAVVILPVGFFLLFGWRVDVNQFSMHSFYRNRLARCYLGASNTARNPDPLTGFDVGDIAGMRMSNFQPKKNYTGPLPIFCATLNISVGEDLAWQERKAASFAFSPVLSGYYVPWTGGHQRGELSYNGFVPTERFADEDGGIHISTAAAISGAAISPNWGYHTSPPMAFLLTMFNMRLGWWMENPRRSFLAFNPNGPLPRRFPYPTPRFAPFQLVRELLGRIGDDRRFVYLTDGGHFDNMGLYELVRRRCYEVVICDAEEDAGPVFEGIGMAIRKCRIDFGVEIELDLNKLATDAATKLSKVHWILGSIKYPETAEKTPGRILYIKSSITGREAGDVYNYRLQHTPFPQDSTSDQWFTESQFESYRRLGQQVVDECPFL